MTVGSMADSMGVYLSAKILQKLLGLGRLLLFIYLVQGQAQFALWGLGVAIFSVAAPLITLGSPNALARYASLYEARGQLRRFCRNAALGVLACTAVTGLLAFGASDWITRYVMASSADQVDLHLDLQRAVCWVALANAVMLALYLNLTSVLYGLRTYRLVAVVELLFGVLFTGAGVAVLLVWPTGLAALVCHLACLAASTAVGAALLWAGLARLEKQPPPLDADALAEPLGADGKLSRTIVRMMSFGLVALAANTAWGVEGYIGLWLINRCRSKAEAGVFSAFLSIGQPVMFLADAAWAVVFSHVARRWEHNDRDGAMFTLEAAYKAVAMLLMTLTIVIYLSGPLWIHILPAGYREGLPLLGGLLLFFQSMIHLALLTILAKLHERPWVIFTAAAAAIAVTGTLGLGWTVRWGMVGSAWAAGAGCLAGVLTVSAVYLLASRTRLTPGSWIILACPALLLLPAWAAAAAWAGLLAVALATPLILTRRERPLLASQIASMARRVRLWR